jgi:hypothetical protein
MILLPGESDDKGMLGLILFPGQVFLLFFARKKLKAMPLVVITNFSDEKSISD